MKDKPFTDEQVGVIGTIVAVRLDAKFKEFQEALYYGKTEVYDMRGFSDDAKNIALDAVAQAIDYME